MAFNGMIRSLSSHESHRRKIQKRIRKNKECSKDDAQRSKREIGVNCGRIKMRKPAQTSNIGTSIRVTDLQKIGWTTSTI